MILPNWCYNTLVISGSPDELKRFKEFAQTIIKKSPSTDDEPEYVRLLDFNNFISPEEDKKRLIEQYNAEKSDAEKQSLLYNDFETYWFNKGGYNWCVENWGTKWNSTNASLDEDKDGLTYSFDTAWSPPTPVIIKASELFPTLTFVLHMEEESHAFAGSETYKAGALVDQEVREQTNTKCPHCGKDISHWTDQNLIEVECWECGKYLGEDVEEKNEETK